MTEQLAPIEPTTKREKELRDRAVRDYALLQSVGLDTTRTFFAPGTEATIAKRNGTLAKKRRDHEALDLAHEGLDRLIDTVLAEDRQDVAVPIGFDPERNSLETALFGGLRVGGLHLAPTDRAWSQIAAKRPPGHAACGADIAAWLPKAAPHEAVLRHRKLPANRATYPYAEARELYAVVSPSYVPYDLDRAAGDLRKVVPHDARCRARYDGQRATVDVVLANPYYLDGGDAAGVGETHRVVLRMRTADDGSGGYHLSLLAERVRCINLTLLHSKRSLFHGTHRQDNLGELVQEALGSIAPTMEQFADTWRKSWRDYWVDRYTKNHLSGEEAITRIVKNGKYRIPGLGEEGTLDAALAALKDEPGDSKAHVHNALTAAAHKSPVSWASRWADEDAEEQASKLLYQTVSWLQEPEPEATDAN